ncbi:tRNA (adenosine(37)-N6)-threonylcarbamoyltransferase complex dimerization subunit type 1 TsaB [Oricola sp.]|uniref:tRNA (adenosine(37)-N6)-threonylcarbamoyltransferase complex dimerization subunit type 1 TsaB n=1 Tax=Oricola sp. TaxID=1979950 RepID=UPI003BABCE81
MLTLAIDTAANFCSACLHDSETGGMLAAEERDIGRGHAEQLIDVVGTVLQSSGKSFDDIAKIAVAVGPGSFTGIRVGVAAARGFGLALGVPVAGVTTLEALHHDVRAMEAKGAVTVAVRGGRGQVFMQSFGAGGEAVSQAAAVDEDGAMRAVPEDVELLAGNAAAEIAAQMSRPVQAVLARATGSIGAIAILGARSDRQPVPLYLRGADAKPQHGFALPRAGEQSRTRA